MQKSTFIRNFIGFGLLVATGFYIVGCGNTTSKAVDPTFTSLYNNVFSVSCANCHVSGGAAFTAGATEIDFSSQSTAYTTLVGSTVHGNSTAGNCSGVNNVTPSNASTSYIAEQFVSSMTVSTNFVVMGCSPYAGHSANLMSSDEQTALVNWIQGGALNN